MPDFNNPTTPQRSRAGATSSGNPERSAAMIPASKDLIGCQVTNHQQEDLGKIEDIMVEPGTGRVAYGVLSFGGFLGLGDKLFAIPWNAMTYDRGRRSFLLNVNKESLKNAPGFDRDNWPNMADTQWGTNIHSYYGSDPYWK